MAFFDDIGKKISQTGQDMVQKTKDTAETMRLNSAISDEEKRIQSLYLEIGKRYFELHADDYDPQLEEPVLCVKEANTKIAGYTEQLNRIKGLVRCATCGADVPIGTPFCTGCGAKMPVVETAVEPAIRRCKKCGLPLPDGAGFCTNCGTASPIPATNDTRCAHCGSPVPPDMAFCTNCGNKVAAPAPDAPQGRRCPNCGTATPEGMIFCTTCGTQVPL